MGARIVYMLPPLLLLEPGGGVRAPTSLTCAVVDGAALSVKWAPVEHADIYSVAIGDASRQPANPFGWRTTTGSNLTIHDTASHTVPAAAAAAAAASPWVKVRAHVDGIGGYG
jgi:hypothetical protein